MSRTFKIQANYNRFKQIKPRKANRKIEDKMDIMEVKYKGYRSGNNRKSDSKSKIQNRRIERAKNKINLNDSDLSSY